MEMFQVLQYFIQNAGDVHIKIIIGYFGLQTE